MLGSWPWVASPAATDKFETDFVGFDKVADEIGGGGDGCGLLF